MSHAPESHFSKWIKKYKYLNIALIYLGTALVVIHFAEAIVHGLHMPALTFSLIVVLALAGLPIVLIIAWAMGNKKSDVAAEPSAAKPIKKNWFKIIVASVLSIGLFAVAIFFYNRFFTHSRSDAGEKTIAVLPFKNISINKEENEPFCVGVALELQKKLEWMGELITIAPQSVEKFRDTKLSIADIASELGGIKYILQGTVQRDKNKVKVFASLIDAGSGKELWSDNFPGEMEDIFSLQENIAQQIADALQVKITPEEKNRIERILTKNPKALDAYNDALSSYVNLVYAVHPLYWDSLSSNTQLYSTYLKTLSLCDRVIEIDPAMAEAYVLKGKTYFYKLQYGAYNSSSSLLDTIAFWGNKALEIDKTSTDAYVLISNYFEVKNKPDSRFFNLEKALAINTNNFDVNRELGKYYSSTDYEKSIRYFKKAIRLNPLSVWTPGVYLNLANTYNNLCDFEKAEINYKKSLELSNNTANTEVTLHWLTNLYLHWDKADSVFKYSEQWLKTDKNALYQMAEAYCNLKNDCAKAAQLYEELWNRYQNHVNPHRWAVALIKIGKKEQAAPLLDSAFITYKRDYPLSYDLAGMYALKSDKINAFRILKQFDWQWGSPYLIQYDRLFDNIRDDKEFKDIIQNALDEKSKQREKIRKLEEGGKL